CATISSHRPLRPEARPPAASRRRRSHALTDTEHFMIHLLGISGSLRKDSLNTALLHSAATLIEDATLDVATLHGIPLYDGDLEAAEGLPPAAQVLQDRIRACDGLILSTPEYNNGIPGVFKNAID